MDNTPQFTITPEVLNLGVTGNYLLITGLQNKQSDETFSSYRESEIKN